MATKKLTIQDLKDQGLIAYEYVRGSWAHGLQIEGKSDIDIGGVYFAPFDQLLGLRDDYQPQVSDEKNDTTYYEFGRWMELVLKSNPQALETLYVSKEFVRGPVHPAIQYVIDHRDAFVTKSAVTALVGYSVDQIDRARGLNKKIVNPVTERKDILDFCYTFKKQGSQPIKDYLAENHLDQKYCGVVNIPNMKDVFGLYYDFAAYFKFEFVDKGKKAYNGFPYNETDFDTWCDDMGFCDENKRFGATLSDYEGFVGPAAREMAQQRVCDKNFFHYTGIVHPDELYKSNTVRLCSVPKGELPLVYMTYNKDAYTKHCKDYASYKEWEQKRNPVRYESNLGKNYDAKNMCECTRLIHTGLEIAKGEGFNVKRTWDRDFLLNIKNHGMEYDDIITYVVGKHEELKAAMKTSNLPDTVDKDELEDILIKARYIRYKVTVDPGSPECDYTTIAVYEKQ